MADLQALKAKVLADGVIDDAEAQMLRKEVYADGKIDKHEIEMLADIRNQAKSVCAAFEDLFFSAAKDNVLHDGVIDSEEAAWLRKALYADGKIDDREKQLLRDLKAGAKKTCPEFDALCKECLG
jgi:hypothetical protein